ncbi:hypothetical protein TIFTF001_051452 [Ficus carica]|uniref:RNA-dependent RNA polymerase n=1 Tax=Ficus carica TaxID=3494 RepID=A0AA88CQ75_FICCA|nr:hypothetical protein TIFTF001_051452 [Ficus carica]
MATNDLDRNHLRRQSPSPPSPSSSSRCSSLFPPPSKIPRLTPQALATEALGELEFRKQFLILNYFAGYCKGPFLVKTRTHLHNVLDDDNILMVKFADTHDPHNAGYGKIAKKGIPVGLRLYRFFVFKDGGKEEKKKSPTSSSVKCYFVRTLSKASIDQNASYILSNKTICEARQLFMHAHTVPNVSNYMARFSLILSKTHKLEINLSSVNVEIIEDDESGNPVYRDGKPLVHTDGTGFISEDLASLCPKNLFKGQCINNENIESSSRDTNSNPNF